MQPTVPQISVLPEAGARARRTIVAALSARADMAKRTASSRALSGSERAGLRAEWRDYAQYCRVLARLVETADPAEIGALLRASL